MGGDASNETYAKCAKTHRSVDHNEGRSFQEDDLLERLRHTSWNRAAKDDSGLFRKEDK